MIKIVLIGTGKTGQKIIEYVNQSSGEQYKIIGAYNRGLKASDHQKEIVESDVVIVFTPGEAVSDLFPLLLSLNKNCVIGSTGFEFEERMDSKLKERGLSWVYASNYSKGMVVVKSLLSLLGEKSHLFKEAKISISDTHHIHKKDSPSGTALSWRRWFLEKLPKGRSQNQIQMDSVREGEILGIHTLKIETPFEKVSIRHEAKDRLLFAEGALFAATSLKKMADGALDKKIGLLPFETLVNL